MGWGGRVVAERDTAFGFQRRVNRKGSTLDESCFQTSLIFVVVDSFFFSLFFCTSSKHKSLNHILKFTVTMLNTQPPT